MNIEFHNPELLWLLAALPVYALLKGRAGRSSAVRFSSVELARSVSGSFKTHVGKFLFLLRILPIALFIVALARPQQGEGFSEVEASGLDIMLVIDLSGSMSAIDFAPDSSIRRKQRGLSRWNAAVRGTEKYTRYNVVKDVVEDFIRDRENDRIGLVAFAGDAYLVSPLTLNHEWLENNLKRLSPLLMSKPGTAIGAAIGTAANTLREIPSKERIMILLTDGANTDRQIPPVTAAEAAAKFGVKIYTILAGKEGRVWQLGYDPKTGDYERDRDRDLYLYVQGNQHEPDALKEIAEKTGGQFFKASNKEALSKIYEEINQLEKTEIKLRKYKKYKELFLWPILAGLVLFLLEVLLANTVFRRLP